jgi:hypothetical protein
MAMFNSKYLVPYAYQPLPMISETPTTRLATDTQSQNAFTPSELAQREQRLLAVSKKFSRSLMIGFDNFFNLDAVDGPGKFRHLTGRNDKLLAAVNLSGGTLAIGMQAIYHFNGFLTACQKPEKTLSYAALSEQTNKFKTDKKGNIYSPDGQLFLPAQRSINATTKILELLNDILAMCISTRQLPSQSPPCYIA